MEARKITVVSTKTQMKNVFMSTATTLAELKADLRQNGIDYEGMTFYEGTSKVELKDDASVLPHNIPYKGQITNELVFMLTNTNKKIKSGAGMSRAEAYTIIKANNLQNECRKIYGKNFTVCKNAELTSLINNHLSQTKKSINEEDSVEIVDTKARAATFKLLKTLSGNELIEDFEELEIKSIFMNEMQDSSCDETFISPYSDDEIDKMFGFVNK